MHGAAIKNIMDTLFNARLKMIGDTKIMFSLPSMLQNFIFMPG
jgi:hypothetical protein